MDLIKLTPLVFFNTLKHSVQHWILYGDGFITHFVGVPEKVEVSSNLITIEFKGNHSLYLHAVTIKEIKEVQENNCNMDLITYYIYFEDSLKPPIEIKVPKIALISKEEYIQNKKKEYLLSLLHDSAIDLMTYENNINEWSKEFEQKISECIEALESEWSNKGC